MDYTELGFREDFDPNNRVIKQETFIHKGKEYYISTVDLGINHGFLVPLYYETMIFDGAYGNDVYQNRYATRKEAGKGHLDTLENIKNGTLQLINGYFEKLEESQ